jgi:hypothetical protein
LASFPLMVKCWREKEDMFFLAVVSEVSFHGCLVLLLWACGCVAHYDKNTVEETCGSPHGTQEERA